MARDQCTRYPIHQLLATRKINGNEVTGPVALHMSIFERQNWPRLVSSRECDTSCLALIFAADGPYEIHPRISNLIMLCFVRKH